MAQVVSISLAKFTASVQAAVKAAVAKHPKFKLDAPTAVAVAYLIRGIPVPEGILSTVTNTSAHTSMERIAGWRPEWCGFWQPSLRTFRRALSPRNAAGMRRREERRATGAPRSQR
jgi:hypothetical protein